MQRGRVMWQTNLLYQRNNSVHCPTLVIRRHPHSTRPSPSCCIWNLVACSLYGLLLHDSRPILVKNGTIRWLFESMSSAHLYLFLGAPVERIALDSKPRHPGWFQRAFVFKLKGLCITRVKGPTQLELVAGG